MSKRREMESWGDVNAAYNRLVREGVLAAYRTSLDADAAEPRIRIVPGHGVARDVALQRARGVLSGVFVSASVALAE